MRRTKLFGCILLIMLSVLLSAQNVYTASCQTEFMQNVEKNTAETENCPILRTVLPGRINITHISLSKTGTMNIKWNADTYADGYRVQFSTTSNFSKPTSRYIAGRKTLTATINGLDISKRYYVRICGYSFTPDVRRVYGAWSSSQNVVAAGTHLKQTISVKKTISTAYKPNGKFSLNASAAGTLSYSSNNSKVAVISSNGTVTMKGCGLAVITVNAAATSKYDKNTVKVNVKIQPAQTTGITVKSSAPKAIAISWHRDTKVDGYEIQYSANKSFSAGTTSTGYTTKNSTVRTTVGGLSSGSVYYVRVRGYKIVNNVKWAGMWSTVVPVTVR